MVASSTTVVRKSIPLGDQDEFRQIGDPDFAL